MAKILLIPGYGSGYKQNKNHDKYYEFSGFKKQIDQKNAVIFKWFFKSYYQNFNSLNPFAQISLYKKEKLLAKTLTIQLKLKKNLRLLKPEFIICHSMGSSL